MDTITDTRTSLRGLCVQLAQERQKATQMGDRIVEAAKKRLELVQKRIEDLTPHVHLQDEQAKEYHAMIYERARLKQVILRGDQSAEER